MSRFDIGRVIPEVNRSYETLSATIHQQGLTFIMTNYLLYPERIRKITETPILYGTCALDDVPVIQILIGGDKHMATCLNAFELEPFEINDGMYALAIIVDLPSCKIVAKVRFQLERPYLELLKTSLDACRTRYSTRGEISLCSDGIFFSHSPEELQNMAVWFKADD